MNKIALSSILEDAIIGCVAVIIFAAPFSKSISEICIALAMLLWIIKKAVNSEFRIEKGPLVIPLSIFVVSTIPSLFNSDYMALSMRAFFTKILKFALLSLIITETLNARKHLKWIFFAALIIMAVILIDGLVQYYFTVYDLLHYYPSFKHRDVSYPTFKMNYMTNYPSSYRLRPIQPGEFEFKGFPTASFPYPNDLAAWTLLFLFPLVSAALFGLKEKRIKFLASIISLGLFYLFFLAKVRSAWLALGISTLYIALFKKKLWLVIFLILMVAIPYIFKMEMAEHIFGFSSFKDRIGMWTTGWKIFRDHPIIGSGINTFFVKFKEYRQDEARGLKGSYAHNCYLQMAADTGVIGLAAFLWLVFVYFNSIRVGLRDVNDPLYGSIIFGISVGIFAFLVQSFFDTNLYSLNLATLFWVAIGLSQGILKMARSKFK